ncbi:hypothetical protein GE09DRAFT_774397 [Coniochaeta sp. 2T2.1]|nr:hypothetical protein GE09DRAFT_774397 [Coniochaeta sp. 2T2.1]
MTGHPVVAFDGCLVLLTSTSGWLHNVQRNSWRWQPPIRNARVPTRTGKLLRVRSCRLPGLDQIGGDMAILVFRNFDWGRDIFESNKSVSIGSRRSFILIRRNACSVSSQANTSGVLGLSNSGESMFLPSSCASLPRACLRSDRPCFAIHRQAAPVFRQGTRRCAVHEEASSPRRTTLVRLVVASPKYATLDSHLWFGLTRFSLIQSSRRKYDGWAWSLEFWPAED